jgi:hypothetical protein
MKAKIPQGVPMRGFDPVPSYSSIVQRCSHAECERQNPGQKITAKPDLI